MELSTQVAIVLGFMLVNLIGFIGLMTVAIVLSAIWLSMLADVIRHDFKNPHHKTIWLSVVVFGNWIGSIVYYFAVKRNTKKGGHK